MPPPSGDPSRVPSSGGVAKGRSVSLRSCRRRFLPGRHQYAVLRRSTVRSRGHYSCVASRSPHRRRRGRSKSSSAVRAAASGSKCPSRLVGQNQIRRIDQRAGHGSCNWCSPPESSSVVAAGEHPAHPAVLAPGGSLRRDQNVTAEQPEKHCPVGSVPGSGSRTGKLCRWFSLRSNAPPAAAWLFPRRLRGCFRRRV